MLTISAAGRKEPHNGASLLPIPLLHKVVALQDAYVEPLNVKANRGPYWGHANASRSARYKLPNGDGGACTWLPAGLWRMAMVSCST